jgi:hypothetical protein
MNAHRNRSVLHLALLSGLALSPAAFAQQYGSVAQAMNAEWAAYVSAELDLAAGIAPVSLVRPEHTLANALRDALTREVNTALQLNQDSALRLQIKGASPSLAGIASGIAQQRSFSPTLVRQLAGGTNIAVGGVFTYETFSSTGLGITTDASSSFGEVSTGSSIFLGLETPAWNGLTASLSGRSTTRMDAFRSYRGVFAESGRFDLPASLGAAVSYQVSPQLKVNANVSRMDYSAIRPFTSNLMPERFVSLLGDSNSPTLQWTDLDVYRVGIDWSPTANQMLNASWSSNQQPKPTSSRLRRALRDELSDRNFTLSYGVGFAQSASFRLSASYAQGNYFFGPSLLQARDYQPGAKLEGEALVEVRF